MVSQIQGSYKLSSTIINKLTKKTIIGPDNKVYPGATKNMIITMLFFSHICSKSGYISNFRPADLALVLHCSLRSTFNIIQSLKACGLIEVSGDNWTGIKDIKLLNNDYSSVSDYTKLRYINTNRGYFDYRSNQGYDKLLNLSLYSLRLLLLLLLNYNEKHGYHISIDTICSQMQISNRLLIPKYIFELKNVLGKEFCIIHKNKLKRQKYGSLIIKSNEDAMKPQYGLHNNQDSYYNNLWKTRFRLWDIYIPPNCGTPHKNAGRIYAIVSNFLQKNLSLEIIENSIASIIKVHGILNQNTYTDIYDRLISLTS